MTPGDRLAWSRTGAGPALVFLHGYGAHRGHWDPWLPVLSSSYDCVTVDLPGFGSAPAPRGGDFSIRGMATAVADLVEALDLRGCTLIGHSLGGGVALIAALDLLDRAHEEGVARLGRLVSVAGAAYPQREPPFVHLARRGRLAELGFAMLPKRWLVRKAMEAIVEQRDAVTPARVESYAAPMRSADRRRAFLECARHIVPPDVDRITARIPDIDVPALCLWGRQDRVVPLSIGQRLASELPRGRLATLENCGHQVVEEKPSESLALLLGFLEASSGSKAGHITTGSGG